MRLPRPFFRLPVRFDAERLREEVSRLPPSAWARHPTNYEGNSSVRLISVDGGENDRMVGSMRPTAHLAQLPYVRQVLASFGVVWSRSRLMRLAPHSEVPEHADINYHWFHRVRVHIPITTRPEVRFWCDGEAVHMAPGEAWIFDNWRRHRVENPTSEERVHLVADTSGSAAFWQFVAAGDGLSAPQILHFAEGREAPLLTEQYGSLTVMPPAEIEMLLSDLRQELVLEGAQTDEDLKRLTLFKVLLDGFCREWRQLWVLHGGSAEAIHVFRRLIDNFRARASTLATGIQMRTNSVPVMNVLEGRVLQHALQEDTERTFRTDKDSRSSQGVIDRPVFVVAAPRSGSTLLYETLAATPQFATFGGEAHWLFEGQPALRPGAPGVDSNRLHEGHFTEAIATAIRAEAAARLRDYDGNTPNPNDALRLLEKTPKNCLRIPMLKRIFPDARFIFLWRDPRENISSIMEAWRDGGWVTYPALEGWDGPWSLLLPPGWRALRGRPLQEVAAYQWDCANRTALDDLQRLDEDDWICLNYHDLLDNPADSIRQLCRFAQVDFDGNLRARTAGSLPLSRYTHTPPRRDKWRRNEQEILEVLPMVQFTWRRLQELQYRNSNRKPR